MAAHVAVGGFFTAAYLQAMQATSTRAQAALDDHTAHMPMRPALALSLHAHVPLLQVPGGNAPDPDNVAGSSQQDPSFNQVGGIVAHACGRGAVWERVQCGRFELSASVCQPACSHMCLLPRPPPDPPDCAHDRRGRGPVAGTWHAGEGVQSVA